MKRFTLPLFFLFFLVTPLSSQTLEERKKSEAYRVPSDFYIYYKGLVDSFNTYKRQEDSNAPQIKELVERTLSNSYNAYVYITNPKHLTRKSEIEKSQRLVHFLNLKKGVTPLEVFQKSLNHLMVYKEIKKDKMTPSQRESYESFERSFTSPNSFNTTYNEFFYDFLKSEQINTLLKWKN